MAEVIQGRVVEMFSTSISETGRYPLFACLQFAT
jgi:hypothetical protein